MSKTVFLQPGTHCLVPVHASIVEQIKALKYVSPVVAVEIGYNRAIGKHQPFASCARCIALFYREFSHAVLKPHFKPHPGGRLVAYQHGIKRTNKDKTTLFFNNL